MSGLIYLYAPAGERMGTFCPDTGRAQIGDVLLAPERACRAIREETRSFVSGDTVVLWLCSECENLIEPSASYCPDCGAKVVD